jgi:5-methylthioadenosine/S-adenosylhomocysteine deaminase
VAEALRQADRCAGRLPARGDFVIRGAYVATMDPALGDMPAADVLVREGHIVAVGAAAVPPDAEVISGAGMLLIPGFVDTHWHLWNSFMRGLIGPGTGRDYFTVKRHLAPYYRPVDFYRAARLALAEAIDSGITTVHNWDHNLRSPEDADANILAQLDMGIRGRFSYGCPDNFTPHRLMDLADLERFRTQWVPQATDHLVTLGIAVRGPFRTPPEIYMREWDAARNAGLPITMHCDRCMREAGGCLRCNLLSMREKGLLGPDIQIVHAVHAAAPDIEAMAETGTHLSLSPQTEMRTMGFPKVSEMLAAGVLVSLSIDTTATPSNADMISQMRVVLSTEAARVESSALTPRRMLQMATLDGARDLGLADNTGSITPGKRADLVMLRMNDFNMIQAGDPVDVLVLSGLPQNIDTVIVDGRILKRDGELVAVDPVEIVTQAHDSIGRMLDLAGWEIPSTMRAS